MSMLSAGMFLMDTGNGGGVLILLLGCCLLALNNLN
jgi:hypothetical protein